MKIPSNKLRNLLSNISKLIKKKMAIFLPNKCSNIPKRIVARIDLSLPREVFDERRLYWDWKPDIL